MTKIEPLACPLCGHEKPSHFHVCHVCEDLLWLRAGRNGTEWWTEYKLALALKNRKKEFIQ